MEDMRQIIGGELDRLEQERGVRVLLAVESGSRAWGFDSPDSDFDVRFVYARPAADYLRLEESRDTIEWRLDETLDISGWDIAKLLRLLRASNPSAFEWLATDIVYREDPSFAQVRNLAPACYAPKAGAFHYLSLAANSAKPVLDSANAQVSAKKYLYAVRALLAARHVLTEGRPAPMRFEDLSQAAVPEDVRDVISALLAAKREGDEHNLMAPDERLNTWISEEHATLTRMAEAAPHTPKPSWEPLNEVFRAIILS